MQQLRHFLHRFTSLSWQEWALAAILLFALIVRLINLGEPPTYYFDEVYHGVTAKAYARNDPAGYEWWHEAPEPGTAYEWLHPPIGKLLMALGWKYFGETAWAWRVPGILFGVGLIWLIYGVALRMFNNKTVGVIAALLAALDGLILAQSRIGMNDIFVTWFMVATVGSYFLSRKYLTLNRLLSLRWLFASGVCAGLSLSTKWTGVYVLGMIGTFELALLAAIGLTWIKRLPLLIAVFVVVPAVIYVLSYGQFWLQGHTIAQFEELHRQIWWYQTNLDATHSYQSQAWEWPLVIRPVWYYVKYYDNGLVSNIYNLANPVLGWFGLIAVVGLLFHIRIDRLRPGANLSPLFTLAVAYAWSWMPWLLSPRIMFFYHYTPAIPWLCMALAYQLYRWWREKPWGKELVIGCLALIAVTFFWLSPMWLNIPLPEKWWPYIFWLPTWR